MEVFDPIKGTKKHQIKVASIIAARRINESYKFRKKKINLSYEISNILYPSRLQVRKLTIAIVIFRI